MAVDWHRRFKFWERVAIMFGFPLQVKCRVFMMHKPGQVQPIFAGEITQWETPQAQSIADGHGQVVPPDKTQTRWVKFKRGLKKRAVKLAWMIVRKKLGTSAPPESLSK